MTSFLSCGAKLLSGKEVPSQGPILESSSMDSHHISRRHCDVSLPQTRGLARSTTAAINRHQRHAHGSISGLTSAFTPLPESGCFCVIDVSALPGSRGHTASGLF